MNCVGKLHLGTLDEMNLVYKTISHNKLVCIEQTSLGTYVRYLPELVLVPLPDPLLNLQAGRSHKPVFHAHDNISHARVYNPHFGHPRRDTKTWAMHFPPLFSGICCLGNKLIGTLDGAGNEIYFCN